MTTSNSSNKTRAIVAVVTVLAVAGGLWAFTPLFGKKAPALPAELKVAANEDPGAAMDKMREMMDRKDLTDEQRRQYAMNMRDMWEKRIDDHVNEYYKAKPADREGIINKHIDEFEKYRKMREDRMKQDEDKAKEDGKDEKDREKEREKEREQWRKRMGDRTREERKNDFEKRDPNKQAQRMAYFGAVHKQMEARGIQPPRGGGFGGMGGGGRGGRG